MVIDFLFLWLILTAMIWGRAGHPVSHPECTGGIKVDGWVGVHIGGGGVFANIENASTLRKAE